MCTHREYSGSLESLIKFAKNYTKKTLRLDHQVRDSYAVLKMSSEVQSILV